MVHISNVNLSGNVSENVDLVRKLLVYRHLRRAFRRLERTPEDLGKHPILRQQLGIARRVTQI
jgi:hypothetical protein